MFVHKRVSHCDVKIGIDFARASDTSCVARFMYRLSYALDTVTQWRPSEHISSGVHVQRKLETNMGILLCVQHRLMPSTVT